MFGSVSLVCGKGGGHGLTDIGWGGVGGRGGVKKLKGNNYYGHDINDGW